MLSGFHFELNARHVPGGHPQGRSSSIGTTVTTPPPPTPSHERTERARLAPLPSTLSNLATGPLPSSAEVPPAEAEAAADAEGRACRASAIR